MMPVMKRISILLMILLLISMTGCGKEKVVVVESSESAAESSETASENAGTTVITTDDCEGTITFEVEDAYITTDLTSAGVDLTKIDPYMFVSEMDSNEEEVLVDYPNFIASDNSLTDGCTMYLVHMKVTNTDAEFKEADQFGYDSPYMFRADNIRLNYISDDQKSVVPLAINYFSLRNEDESKWCTFEVKPGESIEYEIGFILGPIVADSENQKLCEVHPENMFLSSGTEQYYRIDWEK